MPLGFSRLVLSLGVCVVLAGGIGVIAQETTTPASATAAAPTPEQVAAGKRVWNDAACYNCHGTNGQGGNSKDFPRGPSLRTSQLDAATTLDVIACGLPGTQMAGWAKGAYTERPCFGELGPVPEDTRVLGVYDEKQLNDLMAFINATFRKGALQ
jgi:hypothetical protein